jgi:chloramphenicol 3-O-phosphotransferase
MDKNAIILIQDLVSTSRTEDGSLAHLLLIPDATVEVRSSLMPLTSTPFEVTSTSVHGDSTHLELRGENGRTWTVVLGIVPGDPARVSFVEVHEGPPQAFAGTPRGFAVCVGGASSSGKSSLMKAMAERASTPWTYFEERSLGTTPHRWLIWPEVSGPLPAGFRAAIRAFLQEGNQVILSGRPDSEVVKSLEGIPQLLVGLVCPLDVLVDRQSARRDRWPGLVEETFAMEHPDDQYDLRVDTAQHSPDEAADIVLRAVADRLRS